MNNQERSTLVRERCVETWEVYRGIMHDSRNGYRLIYDRQPDYIRNKDGLIVGVDAWVRLHGPTGHEIQIDPHRRIINPPTSHLDNYDPLGAFTNSVWDSVAETPNAKGWRTQGTVDTIYPSLDGRIDSSAIDYTDSWAGTSGLSVTTTTDTTAIGQRLSGGLYSCYQQFWAFDTSAIDDSDAITAVDLSLWLVGDSTTDDFTVEVRQNDWGSTLETSDFVPGDTLSSKTLLASINSSGIGSTGSYKTLTSETAFLTVTNIKTGTVRCFGSSNWQRTGEGPISNEYMQFSQSSTTGTTQDPKLTITHNATIIPFIGWGIPIA